MKRIFLIFLIGILCFGCQAPKKQSDHKYNDGTYESLAYGYGGEFYVETIIKDDHIQDIVVKEHNETPSIGGVAIEQMIQKIKKKNSADVDVVTGATKTSNALKEAIVQAMKSAKNVKE